jgi:hypothetical protein
VVCLLLSALRDEPRAALLVRNLIYPSLFRLRDEVLPDTNAGRRMLQHFETHYEEARDILRSDSDLVSDVIWALEYSLPYIRAMLGEDLSPGRQGYTPTSYVAERLRPQTAREIELVADRFAAQGSPHLADAIADFKRVLGNLVDLTPPEALTQLRREDGVANTA